MIPSLTSGTIENVAPELDLTFLTSSLDPRITFTRTGNVSTRVNSSGLIETVSADTARFDYDPVTLAIKGLLIEEERENLILNSEDFSGWSTLNATVSINVASPLAPSGAQTADRIVETAGSGQHRISYGATVVSGSTYTFSFYAQAGERQYLLVRYISTTVNAQTCFDLGNGTALTTIGSAQIINAGGGWYRCIVTGTVDNTTLTVFANINTSFTTSPQSYTGDITKGLYLWGAQLELGSFATSYIPTTASTVTRTADIAVMTGTDFSDWYSASKGTFRVDATTRASGVCPIISADDNTANESLNVNTDGTAPKFIVTDGGSEQANVSAGTVVANTPMFAYVSYDSSYFGIARPTARQVDTSGTVPTVDRLRIGANQAGAYLNGYVRQIQFWP